MITITLRRIMARRPCYNPIDKGIFDKDHDFDEPISFRWLAERIPLRDVIWCFANLPGEHNALKRHFAVDCAERVRHLMTDERSLSALAVARKHALGETSDHELRVARDAAWASASDAAWASASDAAWASCETARTAAWVAARTAARATAWDAELRWQVRRIIELTETGEWSPVGEKK